MKSEELAVLREILEKQLRELSLRAETTISNLLNTPADFEPDPLDRAIEDQSRAYTLRLRGRESQLINKIKGCLAAIEDGIVRNQLLSSVFWRGRLPAIVSIVKISLKN